MKKLILLSLVCLCFCACTTISVRTMAMDEGVIDPSLYKEIAPISQGYHDTDPCSVTSFLAVQEGIYDHVVAIRAEETLTQTGLWGFTFSKDYLCQYHALGLQFKK